jgi:hypothetical protein
MAPTEQHLGGPSLVSVFDGTGNVAVADVTNPRAQWFDYEGSTISCGFVYTAEVIESLSGEGKTFEFIIPTYQPPKRAVPPGRYLVFTSRSAQRSDRSPPSDAFDECLERVDYYTQVEIEMLFRIVPGTDDRKFRGPIQGDNMLEIIDIGACDLDAHGVMFCVEDVREAIREIQGG